MNKDQIMIYSAKLSGMTDHQLCEESQMFMNRRKLWHHNYMITNEWEKRDMASAFNRVALQAMREHIKHLESVASLKTEAEDAA